MILADFLPHDFLHRRRFLVGLNHRHEARLILDVALRHVNRDAEVTPARARDERVKVAVKLWIAPREAIRPALRQTPTFGSHALWQGFADNAGLRLRV